MTAKDQTTGDEIKDLEKRLKNLKQKNRSEGNYQDPRLIPAAIVIAGLIIAGSMFYTRGSSSSAATTANNGNTAPPQQPPPPVDSGSADNIKPVDKELDHIRGNPDAPVKLVEFSDLECPFCKRFHPAAQQAVDEYGDKVAWVYRHFPLDSIHSQARREAVATECAGKLGGNDKFWEYTEKIFETTPSNNGLDLTQLPQYAQDIGLNRSEFETCLDSGEFDQHIADDLQDATNSGGTGTPYSVIVAQNGKTFPLSGAQPYSAVKSVIDLALKEN